MVKPSAKLTSITFSSGQKIKLKPNEKILLVGPNNSGKSLTLREIVSTADGRVIRSDNNKSVKAVTIQKTGTSMDMHSYVMKYGTLKYGQSYISQGVNHPRGNSYHIDDWAITANYIYSKEWSRTRDLTVFTPGFIKFINAQSRLGTTGLQTIRSSTNDIRSPQSILYDNDGLMNKVSGLFRRAFGKDLFFDFRGEHFMLIHVGTRPVVEKGEDRVSDSYVKKVREFPVLHEEGDGVRSYAGILLEAVAMQKGITLIDEPEAFLHPPHMRKLGETLAEEVSGQLIVATHSSDIMRGFLTGHGGSVRILRMQRSGSGGRVTEAPVKVIKALWEQPDLRYSNALEGIFHEQTIICEDDSDCRLINAVADHLERTGDVSLLDTAYVPAGGKHAIHKIAAVLIEIGVPVIGVYDIDFLSNAGDVESAVKGFGGNWRKIKPLWKRVNSAVTKGVKPPTNDEIKESINKVLRDHKDSDGNLPRGEIDDLLRGGKPWAEVKKAGITAIPNGQAQQDYWILSDALKEIGIVVISKGEIENFYPRVGLHGPKFVMKLLKCVKLDDPHLSDLREFVEMVHELKPKNL